MDPHKEGARYLIYEDENLQAWIGDAIHMDIETDYPEAKGYISPTPPAPNYDPTSDGDIFWETTNGLYVYHGGDIHEKRMPYDIYPKLKYACPPKEGTVRVPRPKNTNS